MKKILFLLVTFFCSYSLLSQTEIPALVTYRPDQSEATVTVPKKTLQIETGFVFKSDEGTHFKSKTTTYNSMLPFIKKMLTEQ